MTNQNKTNLSILYLLRFMPFLTNFDNLTYLKQTNVYIKPSWVKKENKKVTEIKSLADRETYLESGSLSWLYLISINYPILSEQEI